MKKFKTISDPIMILAIASVVLGLVASGATLAHIGKLNFESILSSLMAGGTVSIFIFIAIGTVINMMRPAKTENGPAKDDK